MKDDKSPLEKGFKSSGYPDPAAEIKNRNAAISSPFLRPTELATLSPREAPMIHPTKALLTINPKIELVNVSESTVSSEMKLAYNSQPPIKKVSTNKMIEVVRLKNLKKNAPNNPKTVKHDSTIIALYCIIADCAKAGSVLNSSIKKLRSAP